MSFGLNITENIIPPLKEEEWAIEDGIYVLKNNKDIPDGSYDRPKKNLVRLELSNVFNGEIRTELSEPPTILTMESPDFLFTKLLKNFRFTIYESDSKTFKKLAMNTPENIVDLIEGNISEAANLKKDFNIVYLDFCRNFETEKNVIIKLLPVLGASNFFAFTFSLRHDVKRQGDYKFDLSFNRLKPILIHEDKFCTVPLTCELINSWSYRDANHGPMITLLFHNFPYFARYRDIYFYDKKIWKHFLETLNEKLGE